ncbi:hypothetical protein DY000_02054432 [Brassica cretica]|uniref:Uncharacterized protein n=1 Tax=Brassica cretica TaxID=69181 RepID=A0ABQ7AJ63_BRACR|nr:hypothetical protein DY000_02054432 [Brassica cretica]
MNSIKRIWKEKKKTGEREKTERRLKKQIGPDSNPTRPDRFWEKSGACWWPLKWREEEERSNLSRPDAKGFLSFEFESDGYLFNPTNWQNESLDSKPKGT